MLKLNYNKSEGELMIHGCVRLWHRGLRAPLATGQDDSGPDNQIRQWLQDIGVAKCSGERLVIFVSRGGTCRCAMAKVARAPSSLQAQS